MAPPGGVHADAARGGAGPPKFDEARPFEFTATISRERTVFGSDTHSSLITVRRVGIPWHEPFGPRVEIGLFGGYTSVTQTGNPLWPPG